MKIVQRDDGWWVTDTPEDVDEMGPYETKREADEDRRGVERFLKQTRREGRKRKV